MQESICHSMHLIYMFIGESNLSFYPPFCDEQLDEIGKHFSSLESYSKTKDCIFFCTKLVNRLNCTHQREKNDKYLFFYPVNMCL